MEIKEVYIGDTGQEARQKLYENDKQLGILVEQLGDKTTQLSDKTSTLGQDVDNLRHAVNEAASMTVRKTYPTYAAMTADTSPVDDKGKPLQSGQLVSVINEIDPSENGIYRWLNPGWEMSGKLGDLSGYAKTGGSEKTLKEVDDNLTGEIAQLAGDNLPNLSFSGTPSIDPDHLCNFDGAGVFTGYIKNSSYDTPWVRIFQPSTKLAITGVTITRVVFFRSLKPDMEGYLSHSSSATPVIPEGSQIALLTLRKTDNPDGYSNLRVIQEGSGTTRKELSDEVGNINSRFLLDRSFSNIPAVDYNHLWNVPGGGGNQEYAENGGYDTIWVQIFKASGVLFVTGANVLRYNFFNSLSPSQENRIRGDSNPSIPSNARLALLTLRKSDNPDGYDNLRVTQEGSGLTRSEITPEKIPQFIPKVIGKNLIDPDDILNGVTYASSTGLIESVNGKLGNKMRLRPGILTLQGVKPYANVPTSARILAFNDSDSMVRADLITLNVDGIGNYTVTAANNNYISYWRLVLQYDNNSLFDPNSAQFEYGSEATEFEECKKELVENPAYRITPRTAFMTGASSSMPGNGYFENACEQLGWKAINRAISGDSVMQHATKAWRGELYTQEELEEIDVFITSHIHNYDVAYENPDSTVLCKTVEEYESKGYDQNNQPLIVPLDPLNVNHRIVPYGGGGAPGPLVPNPLFDERYSAGYDYLLKKYAKDCYDLRLNPNSKWYGTKSGKPVIIVCTTQWHDGYVRFNESVKKMAEKHGAVVCDIAGNIGFSYKQTDPADDNSIRWGALHCNNAAYGSGNDVENIPINGIMYTNMGWHPTRDWGCYIQMKRGNILADVLRRITF